VNAVATQERAIRPSSLYYQHKEGWLPLPAWAKFLLDLGFVLATQSNSGNRIVAGLALPIRSYAAPFIATSIIAGKLSLLTEINDAAERFEQISSLPIGTPLIYRKIGKRIKGIFDGIEEVKGCVMILLRAYDELYKIPSALALQVDIPSTVPKSLPRRSNRRTKTAIPPFLSLFLGQERAKAVVLQSHLDCMIIGPIAPLTAEVTGTKLAVQDSTGAFVPGTFQDIIRVQRLAKEAESYRSELYYTHMRELEEQRQENPVFVIFDGAASFLKWRDFWRYSNWVVLLDQTEADFTTAVHTFNEDCVKNEVKKADLSIPLSPPSRMPIAVYQEDRP
jgi:hypothetical protein